mmetsp:Transcript_49332/g.132786  ORF Transcript_49332/g.132786 Transcript_49332/m.132786 type:complete len:296 (-) Transcript_49332:102-989(-)
MAPSAGLTFLPLLVVLQLLLRVRGGHLVVPTSRTGTGAPLAAAKAPQAAPSIKSALALLQTSHRTRALGKVPAAGAPAATAVPSRGAAAVQALSARAAAAAGAAAVGRGAAAARPLAEQLRSARATEAGLRAERDHLRQEVELWRGAATRVAEHEARAAAMLQAAAVAAPVRAAALARAAGAAELSQVPAEPPAPAGAQAVSMAAAGLLYAVGLACASAAAVSAWACAGRVQQAFRMPSLLAAAGVEAKAKEMRDGPDRVRGTSRPLGPPRPPRAPPTSSRLPQRSPPLVGIVDD